MLSKIIQSVVIISIVTGFSAFLACTVLEDDNTLIHAIIKNEQEKDNLFKISCYVFIASIATLLISIIAAVLVHIW